jgi:transcriptional regulator of arginine metabolism
MHVLPGNANALGVLLDHLNWTELLGTVCGDDTILMIARSEEAAEEVTERILGML